MNVLTRLRRLPLTLCPLLTASGCMLALFKPWTCYPRDSQPDVQCSTDRREGHSEAFGYDVYIWHCVEGQRVVVYQFTSEFDADLPRRDEARCGELTEFEKNHPLTAKMCSGPRSGRAWPID